MHEVLKQNIIHGSQDFAVVEDAEAFLRTKNFRLRQLDGWPWISDTRLVAARIKVGTRGFRIDYTTDHFAVTMKV
jgi:hypothetical protein